MATSEIRITKAVKFNAILCALQSKPLPHGLTIADLEDFILHETGLLAKKNSSDKKPTKTQVENEATKAVVLSAVATAGRPVTISDIQGLSVELGEMSNQKVSALVRQLVADGALVRIEDKRKAYFAIA